MVAMKRPSLRSFTEPKHSAVTGALAAPASDTGIEEGGEAVQITATPSDIKTMQVRVNRVGWLEASRLAQDLDMPLEALMVEAMNDVLVKHGKPPVMERRL